MCSSSGTAVQLLAFTNLATCEVILCLPNIVTWGFEYLKTTTTLNCQNWSILWDILYVKRFLIIYSSLSGVYGQATHMFAGFSE